MKHEQCEELLAVYRDLQGTQRARVDEHVQACPDCAALLGANQAMDRDLHALPDPAPDRRLRRAFDAATARERQRAGSRWGRAGTRAGRLAEAGLVVALSLIGVLAAYLWTRPEPAQPAAVTSPRPTPTLSTPGPGVAYILANPPAPGETVELDAYYAGAVSFRFSGGPRPPGDEVACPFNWAQALTDQPYPPALSILKGTRGNSLPAEEPWLVAVTPEAAQPGVRTMPQLPYHARLRGHLGDPAFAQCEGAARIFVVEAVVKVYEETPPSAMPMPNALQLPASYASWPRYHDAQQRYSLPYPPGWQVEQLDDATVRLRGPQWPGYPVTVQVHPGSLYYDQYDPAASASPLLKGGSWGVYQQGWSFGEALPASQRLDGYVVDRDPPSGDRREAMTSTLFSAHGHTYELALTYPLGFDASQELLTTYSAIVEGFRLDVPPEPTPTPPVHQELGPGPFLSQEEAVARLREGEGIELLEGELVSEAEARRRAGACGTYTGHSDGVWLLTVRGTFEGQTRTMLMFVDATTGEQLCGEEINPSVAPLPTLSPGVTATPVPGARVGWRAYTNWIYGVALQYPAHWQPVEGYEYEERYGGPDGFFQLGARSASGEISIDEAAALDANHKLQPYGSSPTIEPLTVQGQEARLVLPSADQPEAMERTAALIVRYPRPVPIRGESYGYFTLYADKEHIQELAKTLEFLDVPTDAMPAEGWLGTLVKECAMAQFDDYFRRDDDARYGIAGATERLEAEIERLRCQPEVRVRVWGRLEAETMDAYGRRIFVERLELLEAPPTPTPLPGPGQEAAEGWTGRVVPSCGDGAVDPYFVRADGMRARIAAGAAAAREVLRVAECEGYPVRVWGTLHPEAADSGVLYIIAERVEKV